MFIKNTNIMKKRLLYAAALLIFATSSAVAQTPDSLAQAPAASANDNYIVNSDMIQLRPAADNDGGMDIEVAGFCLTLGRHAPYVSTDYSRSKPKGRKANKAYITVFSHVEMGFTQLTNVDYSSYAPSQNGFLDQQLGSSFHFSFSIASMNFALNKSRTLYLGLGMQYTVDNFRLANNDIILGNDGGRIVPVMLDSPADKSKFRTTSLGIPVRLRYSINRSWRVTATAYSDFMLGQYAIYKNPKEKDHLTGFNSYQFSVGLAMSYRWLGLYTRYGVTPMFNNNSGLNDCHAFSFGFTLGF